MAKVTITGPSVRDSTTRKDNRPWYAWAAEYQDGGDGGVVTPRQSRPIYPSQGVLSIELEAGIAAWIQNPDGNKYLVTVPNSNAQLWDVIASAVAYPPDTRTEVLASAVGQYVNDNADVIAVDDVVSASGGTAIQFQRQGTDVGNPIPLPSAAWASLLGKETGVANATKAPSDQLPIESAFWWITEPKAVNGRVYVGTCADDRGVWLQEWTQPVTGGAHYLHRYFLGYSIVITDPADATRPDIREDHHPAGIAVAAGKPLVAFWQAHTYDNKICWRISDQNVDAVGPGGLTFGETKTFEIPDNERTAYSEIMVNGTDIYMLHRTGWAAEKWSLTKFPNWGTGTPVRTEVFSSADQFYVKGRMVGGVIRCIITDHPTIGTDNKVWYAEIDLATGNVRKADGTVLGNLDGTNLPLAEASLDLVYTCTGTEKPWGFDVGYGATREIAFATGTTNLGPSATGNTFAVSSRYRVARYTSSWATSEVCGVGWFAKNSFFPSIAFVPDQPNTVLVARSSSTTTSSGTHYVEKRTTSDGGATWPVSQTVDSAAFVEDGSGRFMLNRCWPVDTVVGSRPFDVIGTDFTSYPHYLYGWVSYVRPLPLSAPVKRVPVLEAPLAKGLKKDLAKVSRPQAGLFFPGVTGAYVEGPDLDVPSTGVRLEVDLALPDWTPSSVLTLFAKERDATHREFRLFLNGAGDSSAGRIGVYWSEDGTATKFALPNDLPPFVDGQRAQIAVEFVPSVNAATQYYFKSFYRFADDEPWITLSVQQLTSATSLFASDSPWEIGGRRLGTTELVTGTFYRASVMTVGGRVLAEWRGDRQGATQKDQLGNTWTRKGALVGADTIAAALVTEASTGRTLTNKSLVDTSTFIVDASDATKKAILNVPPAQTTGVTTVISLPSQDATLATIALGETLTNKSFVDTSTFIVDAGDATKKAIINVPGAQTTGTTRTHSLPAVDSTLAAQLTGTATLDFPSVAAQSFQDLTITVTGAAVGDAVALGTPTASVTAGIVFSAWVSAANTVTVRAHNYTAGALDPASGSFKATVVR